MGRPPPVQPGPARVLEIPPIQVNHVRAVCFDFYGTLVPRLVDDPYRELLKNVPDSKVSYYRHHWMTSPVSWKEACADAGISERERVRLSSRLESTLATIRITPAAIRALECCRAMGWRLALASNLSHPYAAPAIRSAADFDAVLLSFETGLLKPSPLVFRRIETILDVAPGHCLMVGDSRSSDIEGALACGWQALWLGQACPEAALDAWFSRVCARDLT